MRTDTDVPHPIYGFLDPEIANKALDLLTPFINETLRRYARRTALNILILDPLRLYDPGLVDMNSEDIFTDPTVILAERQFGDDMATWEGNYRRFSRAKTALSWRTNLDSIELKNMPHLYLPGDCHYGGAAWFKGILSGGSGVEWFFDQMFAYQTSVTCHGLAMQAAVVAIEKSTTGYILTS